mmetsp:Transcript_20712/g.26395  ORF Transcript_20712/g.26395 Transcript_20712/m.26395 type:complete len:919 (+) Transcript_20712:103-2859(+)
MIAGEGSLSSDSCIQYFKCSEASSPPSFSSSKQKWRRAYCKIIAVRRFANGRNPKNERGKCDVDIGNNMNKPILGLSSPKIHVADKIDVKKSIPTCLKCNNADTVKLNVHKDDETNTCAGSNVGNKIEMKIDIQNDEVIRKAMDENTNHDKTKADDIGNTVEVEAENDRSKNIVSEVARNRWRMAVLKIRAAQRFAKGDFTKPHYEQKRLKRCMVHSLFSSASESDMERFIDYTNETNHFLKLEDQVFRRNSVISVMPGYPPRNEAATLTPLSHRCQYRWNYFHSNTDLIVEEMTRKELVPEQLLEEAEDVSGVISLHSDKDKQSLFNLENEGNISSDEEDEDYGDCHVVVDFNEIEIGVNLLSKEEEQAGDAATPDSVKDKTLYKYTSEVSIGDFKPLRVIGSGSSGQVYLVQHRQSGVKYAMKVLNKLDALRRKRECRVMTERDILSKMHSYRLITTLRFAFHTQFSLQQPWNSHLFFVMDYCSGGNLHEMMIRQHQHRYKLLNASDFHLCLWNAGTGKGLDLPLSIAEIKNPNIQRSSFGLPFTYVRFILAEIAQVLLYLHESGYVFRDLKPQNVMLHGDGHIRLGDFGIAKRGIVEGAHVSLRSTSFVGTMEYMAPEMVTGAAQTSAMDWWTMGCLAYELVFGQPPFCFPQGNIEIKDKEQTELFFRIMTPEKSVMYPQPSPCGKEVVDLIRDLLVTKPENRLCGNKVVSHPFFEHICWSDLVKGGGLNEITSSGFHWKEEEDCASANEFEDTEEVVNRKNDMLSDLHLKASQRKGGNGVKVSRSQAAVLKGFKSLQSVYNSVAAPYLPNSVVQSRERNRREILGLPVNQSYVNGNGMTSKILQAPVGTFRRLYGLRSKLTMKKIHCKNKQEKVRRRSSMHAFRSGLTVEKEATDRVEVRSRSGSNFEGFDWCE